MSVSFFIQVLLTFSVIVGASAWVDLLVRYLSIRICTNIEIKILHLTLELQNSVVLIHAQMAYDSAPPVIQQYLKVFHVLIMFYMLIGFESGNDCWSCLLLSGRCLPTNDRSPALENPFFYQGTIRR